MRRWVAYSAIGALAAVLLAATVATQAGGEPTAFAIATVHDDVAGTVWDFEIGPDPWVLQQDQPVLRGRLHLGGQPTTRPTWVLSPPTSHAVYYPVFIDLDTATADHLVKSRSPEYLEALGRSMTVLMASPIPIGDQVIEVTTWITSPQATSNVGYWPPARHVALAFPPFGRSGGCMERWIDGQMFPDRFEGRYFRGSLALGGTGEGRPFRMRRIA
jgi:hypothetical protein